MNKIFKPYVSDNVLMPEFTIRAIIMGCIFGVLFGAANVYLALKAGLTVSASIPISVMAISIGKRFFRTSILENNIIQTTGSAGESIASGVVFTLPAFLFLSADSNGSQYFEYWTILILAMIGGLLGTLMMIPLRRSLIVKEHETLPYPEGTACAQVLIAGDKGGNFAKTAYLGLGAAFLYAILQKVFGIIAGVPTWLSAQTSKWPSARIDGEITPEYLGVGYIIGPRISGQLVAGGVLAWLALIPLLAFLVPTDAVAAQLVKLGLLESLTATGGAGGWDPIAHQFADKAEAVYRAYVRQIGAGAVAAGGFITLFKTLPTIISSFREGMSSIRSKGNNEGEAVARTSRDLSMKVTLIGCLALVLIITFLPMIPGNGIFSKLIIGILVIVFGFFFVTVSSRIVGIIGSSNSPVSGMTIATVMGTSLVFIACGMSGKIFEPMVLVVGGLICIAAANAGNTSQDLKTGFLIGATPRLQQLALFIGVIVSTVVVGFVIKILDSPTAEMQAANISNAIGTSEYPAPQASLMATLIRGLLSFNLDWQFVIVGVFLAVTMELCGVNSLSFAVGAYLPLSTTLPIFAGGCVKGIVDWRSKRKGEKKEDAELGRGSLFATGLVAGGALMGVIVAILSVMPTTAAGLNAVNMTGSLTTGMGKGYDLMGVAFFVLLGIILYRIAIKKNDDAPVVEH